LPPAGWQRICITNVALTIPLRIAQQYSESVIDVVPLGNGHINDTFFVKTEARPFVLQRVNKNVFPNPEQITVNLMALNKHAKEADVCNNSLKIPELLLTGKGRNFFQDEQDNYWRALSFIENTESIENISHISEAKQVGAALGRFHRLTRTLDIEKLQDTLPGFHICPEYLQHYLKVEKTTAAPGNSFCADFIEKNQAIANDLEHAKALGFLVTRVIHGDPKLNNFLFDRDSKCIVSLIDLDTVKPGLIHYDIGDCIRSCCHTLESDVFNLEICQLLLESYLTEMADSLSSFDYQYLYSAIRLIPFELGLRFYTDYLAGNRYFKVTEPEENLSRAIAQFRLCSNIMEHEDEIKKLISY
jgi:Ser/Thr protein kinase RdoA (MazF antagonist)